MKSLKGHFLVASPKLVDPNFFHTVVLLVQHEEEGALGLVLNRPLTTTVKDVWEEVAEGSCDVGGHLYQGGPCEGALMVLHGDEENTEMTVGDGLYFCMRRETIERIVAENPEHARFFVGYAGWSSGQLESELAEGSWLTTPANAKAVFEGDEHLWSDLVRALSRAAVTGLVDPKRIPDDPSVN
jgi:putative transcriptional regulator